MTLDDISNVAPFKCNHCLTETIEWNTSNIYYKNNNMQLPESVKARHESYIKAAQKRKEIYNEILSDAIAEEMIEEILKDMD